MNQVSKVFFPYWNRYANGMLVLTIAAIGAIGCSQRQTSNPAPATQIRASQKVGVRLVQDLMNDPKIKGNPKISVGTFEKTVILNGQVASAAQKARIGHIAKQKATGYKVINQLVVKAPGKNPYKPQKS